MAAVASVDGALQLQSRNILQWTGNETSAVLWELQANSTASKVVEQLAFAASKSVRTSTVILASFNAAAAFFTAMSILRSGYSIEKRNNTGFRFRRGGFSCVPVHDAFPFILSLGITIQSITFAAAQSQGLRGFFGTGCSLIAEFVLPAVFLPPSIQLICALDMIVKGLGNRPFAPRGKWNVVLCIIVVGALYLTTFLVADFARTKDACFMSLYWYIFQYSTGAFVVLVAIIAIITACAASIFVRLCRNTNIDVSDRVTASRMIYYLVVAMATNACVVPFFALVAFGDPFKFTTDMFNAAMVAAVVSNVTGLMNGGLYLFLKSHDDSTVAPWDKAAEYRRQALEHQIRRSGDPRDDPNVDGTTPHHVSGATSISRKGSCASLESIDKPEHAHVDSPPSPGASAVPSAPMLAMLRPVEPASPPADGQSYFSKPPYSLFPGKVPAPAAAADSRTSYTILPAITYTPDASALNTPLASSSQIPFSSSAANAFPLGDLAPPPSMGALAASSGPRRSHQRNSSVGSSATVQIGLRLSNFEDMPALIKNRVGAAKDSVYDLASRSRNPLTQNAFPQNSAEREALVPTLPRHLITTQMRQPPSGVMMQEGGSFSDESRGREPGGREGEAEATDEECDAEDEAEERRKEERRRQEETVTLSPMVYSPSSAFRAKLPSPTGFEFDLPRSQSTKDRTTPRSGPRTTLRRTNTSEAGSTSTGQDNWI